MATAATNPISVAFGRTPSPWGPVGTVTRCMRGLVGAPLPQGLCLWLVAASLCRQGLSGAQGLGALAATGLLQRSFYRRGLLQHSSCRPWLFGHAGLVTALYAPAGAFGGILGTGLGLQGLLQLSSRRQGLG
jgi:hypothetical protein